MKTPPRPLEREHRVRIKNALNSWAASGAFLGLRTRAFVVLGITSGLRTKELLALDLAQILEVTGPRSFKVRSSAYLRGPQSKGRRQGDGSTWDSAGLFVITKAARAALREYIKDGLRRGWFKLPAQPGQPLFIANRGTVHKDEEHPRIDRRTAQYAWHLAQTRAGIPLENQYGVHCLRHEALTRFADQSKDPFRVARYGRMSLKTALRYVHSSPHAIAEIAEQAARAATAAGGRGL